MSSSGFLPGPRAIHRRRITDWWLAAGTIAAANVLEHVENPTQGQLYAGAAATNAWSVSFRTNLSTVANTEYAFDASSGRLIIGIYTSAGANGFFDGAAWNAISLFATGDHSYTIISTGASIQTYRDNVAVGSVASSAVNIGGTARWRKHNDNAHSAWTAAIRAGHVANVALDATQRAALHAAMMALA